MSADVSTSEQIASVGTISAGDPAIGQKISEAMEVVGKDGVITVEDSQTFGIDIDAVRQGLHLPVLRHEQRHDDRRAAEPLHPDD